MKQFYNLFHKKIKCLSVILAFFSFNQLSAQCVPCGANSFTLNFSSSVDTTYTILNQTRSGGPCCGDNNCIRVFVYLNANSDLLNFDVKNPSPSGSAFYSINCGSLTSIGTPVCVFGQTLVCITYCKPGGDSPDYVITATKVVKASPNKTVRVGCAATMTVTGLTPSTCTWTSVFPGAQGAYNSFLSCTSACTLTTVTPTAVVSPYIDYMVSGSPITLCGGVSRDTVRIFTVPGLTTAITPTNAVVCSGGSPTVALTATVSGGAPPYTYTWSTGPTTTSTSAGPGTHTVFIQDTASSCPAIQTTVTVLSVTTPTAPSVSATTPICAGSPLSFTASTAGTTFNWTGPNSFTSTTQNPTIAVTSTASSGNYSVTATTSGCTGPPGTVSVTVNPIPSSPSVTATSPICSGQTLSLTATFTAGATYNWSGPNSFTSTAQNPTIAATTTLAAGVYSVSATIAGCTGPTRTVQVTVNQTPAAATATANTPICSGQNLNLGATATGASFNWTGPNSFSSSAQNPTITSTSTLASGVYTINVTTGGCTSANSTVAVTVNQTPAAATATANTPLCSGQTLNLGASSTGVSYSWNGPNSFTSTAQNPTIAGTNTLASGTYSVFATTLGCTSAAGTVAVTVNQTPAAATATANTPLCSGQSLNLGASSTGVTYSWNGPNSFTSTAQNPTIAGTSTLASGTYSVFATTLGCTSAAGTVAVTVNQTPATATATANTPLCSGQSLNLGASSTGVSYSWNGPNSFTSTAQNPTIAGTSTLASGTYSVFATTLGCTSAAGTVAVTVNQTPAAATATANTPICSGQNLNLGATATGAAFSWTGPNSFTSSVQNPTIAATSTLASGVYTINVTTAGCTSANSTVAVTVNQTPAAATATANTPLCSGQSLNLGASSTGFSYSWNGPNSFTSTAQNPTIAGTSTLASGTYSVFATTLGCTSAAGTVAVMVNQTPAAATATASTPICSGQNLNLGATATGAAFNWTGPNSFTSSVQNPTIVSTTTLASGVYTINVTTAGCTSANSTVAVTVNQTPAAATATANTPICSGQNLNLGATATGASFSWTGPNSFSSSVQNPTITSTSTLASGVYTINVTTAGCTSANSTVAVTVNQTPAAATATANTPICSGQNLNLGATATGAAFNWTGPNSFTSSVQNPTITSTSTLASGVYTINVTTLGCTSANSTVAVTVNQTPAAATATANTPICSGQNLNLGASATGTSFSWTGPNSFSSSVQNPTITSTSTLASGVYTVNVTTAGCTSANSTVAVTVNQTPAVATPTANSPVCSGQNLNLGSAATGANFNWSGPNSFTSSVQNPTITSTSTLASGVYTVNVTTAGCTSASGTVAVTVNQTPAAATATANTPVCSGQNINLGATATGAAFSWTGPNSFTSTVQNPTITSTSTLASGVYTINVTTAGCTSANSTVAVTVNQTPAAATATANTPICSGQSLNLGATSTGVSYNWVGPNSYTSSVQNPTIASTSTLSSGTYSVFATTLGCTSAAATVAVTVNQTPAAATATANTPLCSGQNLNLGATATGTSFSWTGPNSFTSTAQNPTIAGTSTLASGTYSVFVTTAGCTSTVAIVSVTVNETPAVATATASTPVCSGQNINLGASSTGVSYNWVGPNSYTSSIQNPTITSSSTLASGTYSVFVTTLGCTSAAGTVAVTVNLTPVVATATANTPLCSGQNLNLGATSSTGLSYNWVGPNSFTSTTQNPTISGTSTLATGSYSVFVTTAGCTSTAAIVSVTVNETPAAPTATTNAPLCVGQALFLGASNAGTSFSWSGPGGFTSASQTPSIASAGLADAGTYSVTATTLGCTGPAGTVAVTVAPIPAAPVATATTPVCEGQTLNLASTFTAGATYSWVGPNSFTASTQNTSIPSVSLTASGNYSVAVNVGGCQGPYATVNVNVNPIPSAPTATANSPICAGQTLLLSSTYSTAATYSWTGPNSFSSSTQNPSLPGTTTLSSGDYSVAVTVGGCAGPVGIINVTVNPIPASPIPGSNSPICAGLTLSLTASSTGSSYNWSGPNSFTSAVQNPTIASASTLASGDYSVTASDLGCTSPPSIITVSVGPLPAAPTVTVNSPLCSGSTLSLTPSFTVGATYTWSGPNSFTSTTQNPTIPGATTLAAGEYSVFATNNGCPGPIGTVSVSVVLPADVNAGPPKDTICESAVFIPVNGSVTGSTSNGVWSTLGSGTFTNPNNLSTTYTMSAGDITGGTITLVLGSVGGGCPMVTDTIKYIVLPAPSINAGPDLNVCKNAMIPLTATITGVTTTGIWTSTGSGTFVPGVTSLNGYYAPSSSDTAQSSIEFVLETTNNKGCLSKKDTVKINFIQAPSAAFTYSTACATKPVNFMDASTPTASLASFNWDFGDGTGTSTAQNPVYIYSTGNTYTVTHVVTSVNGCTDTSKQAVTVYISPVADFVFSNVCVGNQSFFFDSSTVATGSLATWSWAFGDGGTSTLENPLHLYSNTGVYTVTMEVTSSNGCFTQAVKTVTVNPRPKADFSMNPNPVIAYDNVSFTDLSVPAAAPITSWSYLFGDAQSSTLQNPGHIYTDQGVYTVTLSVIDGNGCSDTTRKDIIVALVPQVPTAFTPNGDGHNDMLLVKGGPFKTISFRVYNNWGELLFSSDDQNKGWDGTYKGQPVPLGVYVWIMDVDMFNGEHIRKTGDITVLK